MCYILPPTLEIFTKVSYSKARFSHKPLSGKAAGGTYVASQTTQRPPKDIMPLFANRVPMNAPQRPAQHNSRSQTGLSQGPQRKDRRQFKRDPPQPPSTSNNKKIKAPQYIHGEDIQCQTGENRQFSTPPRKPPQGDSATRLGNQSNEHKGQVARKSAQAPAGSSTTFVALAMQS